MNKENFSQAYAIAQQRYAEIGVDTENVLKQMQDFHLSLHCWQADDVKGFEVQAGALSGGIQSTGDFPGAARNIDELRSDILMAMSLIPGNHRLNLHEIYGDFKGKVVDRDEVTVEYFQSWIDWAKEHNTKLDFNSTSFSHPKSGNLSLSNPDKGIRDFWIEHTKRCRDISNAIGEAQNDPCLEGKVFGIGLESFTVGSHDFYTAYCSKNNVIQTIDTGHYHPTESPADKVSALLDFVPELMLHVSRPVRWDSDHVTIMDDPTQELFSEIVRADALNRVHYGLDFFDGSINRIGAYVIGSRSAQKCMLRALLEPTQTIRQYELAGEGYKVLALLEEAKALPWQAVYDEFCIRNNVPVGQNFIKEIDNYVAEVTSKR